VTALEQARAEQRIAAGFHVLARRCYARGRLAAACAAQRCAADAARHARVLLGIEART
jgi:hypothetical protein